ncbi:ParB/RepB/Spo0J family partition protein [Cellulomonas alba]|uniref:ParB/RepB/Spo0J family partition protein n=1 Tax=Cellulomonas alba TaxID=3053467 RepID=A0ABT7SFQ4_9CELL|nr:ParB/RepB/Spo0J family partition protein [Cellulomonas alba]MDM7855028.1 ParB/RepB/Spo0J family partition protein [Cellulomonas alba]
MSDKRRGLGRGLGALIPTGADGQRPKGERPVDVFFPGPSNGSATATAVVDAPADPEALTDPQDDGTAARTAEADLPAASAAGDSDHAGEGVAQTRAESASADTATAHAPSGDDGLVPVPGARFAELPVESIRPNPRQPRTVFEEEALDELVGSIREVGVLQPVVVRDVGDGYELIMGERRWRATQAAGLSTIPAIIRETDDGDLLRDALLENLHRSQLNPLEEAAAYQQLLDDFGCTHDELATRIQRSRPQISNTLRLLKLPPLVQRRVAAGVLSAGHARALLGLNDAAAAERLAQRIVAEGLSVRTVEEIVALGGDPEKPARRAAPRAGERNVALDDLASRLSDRFDTRVKVSLGKTRGRLTVEFASVQDLNRILGSLAPEDPGLLRG